MTDKHLINRLKVCLLCTKYIKQYHNVAGTNKHVTNTHKVGAYTGTIKLFIPDYDETDIKWPAIICSSCKVLVCETIKGKKRRKWHPYDTGLVHPIINTRSKTDCN